MKSSFFLLTGANCQLGIWCPAQLTPNPVNTATASACMAKRISSTVKTVQTTSCSRSNQTTLPFPNKVVDSIMSSSMTMNPVSIATCMAQHFGNVPEFYLPYTQPPVGFYPSIENRILNNEQSKFLSF